MYNVLCQYRQNIPPLGDWHFYQKPDAYILEEYKKMAKQIKPMLDHLNVSSFNEETSSFSRNVVSVNCDSIYRVRIGMQA